jgi:hypothetical protein
MEKDRFPQATSDDDGDMAAPSGERRRGRLLLIGIASAVVVVVAGVVVALIVLGGGAEPVDVEEVRRPTGSTEPPEAAVLRPPQGVYLYEGGGTDQLSTPPKEQAEGPSMPATVTHRDDGCWTFRIDYSTNHWQSWDYCSGEGDLDESGGSSYQRWDFTVFVQETTSTFVCDSAVTIDAEQAPGDTWEQSCSGTSTGTEGEALSAGSCTFVGREDVQVGGDTVPAYRYHRERTMSGAQTGTEVSEVWFAAETGMPLRNERHIEVRTDTVIGEVTYTEDADFLLTSLEPHA